METSEKLGVKRGLRNPDGTGVLAGLTNICDVIGYDRKEDGTITLIPGKLIYRGIDLNDIVNEAITKDRFLFEEVVWLLLFERFRTKIISNASPGFSKATGNCRTASRKP